MKVKQFPFNHFQTKGYLLLDEDSKQCAVIDPCMEYPQEYRQLEQALEGYKPMLLLLTHAHPDHICGVERLATQFGLPITTHCGSLRLLETAQGQGRNIGFDINPLDKLPRNNIFDGDVLHLGKNPIRCLYVPGHCPGSMAYYLEQEEMVFTGDALFRRSIGRTAPPGGDYDVLLNSIKTKLFTLPPDTLVLPGHADATSIREEELGNPFIN